MTIPFHLNVSNVHTNYVLESNECSAFLWDALKMQREGREAINYGIDSTDIWGNFPMLSQSNMSEAICGARTG